MEYPWTHCGARQAYKTFESVDSWSIPHGVFSDGSLWPPIEAALFASADLLWWAEAGQCHSILISLQSVQTRGCGTVWNCAASYVYETAGCGIYCWHFQQSKGVRTEKLNFLKDRLRGLWSSKLSTCSPSLTMRGTEAVISFHDAGSAQTLLPSRSAEAYYSPGLKNKISAKITGYIRYVTIRSWGL